MILLKTVKSEFVMSYPAMTVYEFEHFKEEAEVIEYWKTSSIYIICQRPVLYFDEIFCEEESGTIKMKIKQRGKDNKLSVKLVITQNENRVGVEDSFWVEIQFYEKEQQTAQPFKNAAGIKLLNDKQEFVHWLTPERLIFSHLDGRIKVDIEGDISGFLTYLVHYIGQAQNQNIWDRLTGHEKLSKTLALEHPFIKGEFSPFELSLIFLKLDNITEQAVLLPSDSDDVKDFYGKKLTDEEIGRALIKKKWEDVNVFAINDFEAYLVNLFEPKYNKILFKKYPNIKNGLKSLG